MKISETSDTTPKASTAAANKAPEKNLKRAKTHSPWRLQINQSATARYVNMPATTADKNWWFIAIAIR